jgi:hypothetical protein
MKKLITIAIIVLAISCLTQASEIVKYEFGTYSQPTLAPSSPADHITASYFSYYGDGDADYTDHGSGMNPEQAYEVVGGWLHDDYLNYFSFTITIESGWSLDLANGSVKFDADPSTMTGPYQAKVTYLGDPETIIGSEFEIATSGWWTFGAYQNPPPTGLTGTVDFRIYARDATGGGILAIDNVILNGTTAQIPEPTTICLLGLGALSLIRRKK